MCIGLGGAGEARERRLITFWPEIDILLLLFFFFYPRNGRKRF